MRTTILAVLVALAALCAFATAQDTAQDWVKDGSELWKDGYYEEAILAFDKAIQIDPDNAEAWYSKGVNYANMNKSDEALDSFQKVIELNYTPKLVDAWINKAIMLEHLGRYNESLNSYNTTIEMIDPSQKQKLASVWCYKGYLLANSLGELEDAINAFDEALKATPDDERILNMKKGLLIILGQIP